MASNSNSERTNVITMLCFKLERFTQPCFLPFMAAEPRAHRCVRWYEGCARRKLVPNRACEDTTAVVPRIRVADDESGFRSPRSAGEGSRTSGTSLNLYFTNCRNWIEERS